MGDGAICCAEASSAPSRNTIRISPESEYTAVPVGFTPAGADQFGPHRDGTRFIIYRWFFVFAVAVTRR